LPIGDTYDGFIEIFIGEADRAKHGAVGGASVSFGDSLAFGVERL
jgi:hypothetical protein